MTPFCDLGNWVTENRGGDCWVKNLKFQRSGNSIESCEVLVARKLGFRGIVDVNTNGAGCLMLRFRYPNPVARYPGTPVFSIKSINTPKDVQRRLQSVEIGVNEKFVCLRHTKVHGGDIWMQWLWKLKTLRVYERKFRFPFCSQDELWIK